MDKFKKFMVGFGAMILVFVVAAFAIFLTVMLAKYLMIFIPIPGQLIFIGLILIMISVLIGILYAIED